MPSSTSASSPARSAQLLDLGLAPLVGVLDPLRVDPAVGDQPVQGEPGDLSSYRIKAGEQDGLGRVVDDQVDAGHGLEGPDVAALAADDAALHLIARQVQHRHHGLAGLLGGDPLDGQGDDLAGALLAFDLGLVLDVPDDERRFPLGLVLDDGDQLGLGRFGGEAGDALEFAFPFRVFLVELGGAALQVLLARGQGLGALLDPLELLVQPLLAIGEAQLAALEVTAQLADLVLDRADLFFDFPAALGGLFGLVAGSFEDAGGFGLGAGADVLGFLAGLFQLDGVLGWVELRAGRGPAPDDDQREHHREQPDHHERERQSAAHGHPFPSIALGAPLCCNFRFRGLCPGASSRTRRRARRLFSGPAFWLPYVSGCFSSADALLVPGPDFLCRVGQHLAAVRLRLDNLFIKQSNADRRERCVSWMKGALTRGRSGWWGACFRLASGLLAACFGAGAR